MSWQDCFVLGQHLYALRDYNHTVPWLQQSMQLLGEQSYGQESASLDFMEAVVDFHREMGAHETALGLVNHVLSIEPEHRSHLLETRQQLEELITDGDKNGLLHLTARRPGDYHASREFKMYEQVCRGDLSPSPAKQRELRCRFRRSRLGYAPFKVEELSHEPLVFQVHQVVSSKIAEFIQKMARPKIKRSTVYAIGGGGGSQAAAFRTSQGASFNYSRNAATKILSRHVGDLSSLDMNFAEELQVANYGIGGHYEPHWDSFPENHVYDEGDEKGNRIATGIYYVGIIYNWQKLLELKYCLSSCQMWRQEEVLPFPFYHCWLLPKKEVCSFGTTFMRPEIRIIAQSMLLALSSKEASGVSGPNNSILNIE